MSDDLRGDPENPVVQFQRELGDVLERYADVTNAAPEYTASLLVEYADTLRHEHDVESGVSRLSEDVFLVSFDGTYAWIGAPRSGQYADVDVDALDDQLDEDVTDDGITGERIELADLDDLGES